MSAVNMMKSLIVLAAVIATSVNAKADKAYLQATCAMEFPEAMAFLQDSIQRQGYTVSRIQHVDKGLLERGYETDKYKVVFFGKPAQMLEVVNRYPLLIPFVPLNITISREDGRTSVSTLAPEQYSALGVPADAGPLIAQWQQDVEGIVQRYATCQVDT